MSVSKTRSRVPRLDAVATIFPSMLNASYGRKTRKKKHQTADGTKHTKKTSGRAGPAIEHKNRAAAKGYTAVVSKTGTRKAPKAGGGSGVEVGGLHFACGGSLHLVSTVDGPGNTRTPVAPGKKLEGVTCLRKTSEAPFCSGTVLRQHHKS